MKTSRYFANLISRHSALPAARESAAVATVQPRPKARFEAELPLAADEGDFDIPASDRNAGGPPVRQARKEDANSTAADLDLRTPSPAQKRLLEKAASTAVHHRDENPAGASQAPEKASLRTSGKLATGNEQSPAPPPAAAASADRHLVPQPELSARIEQMLQNLRAAQAAPNEAPLSETPTLTLNKTSTLKALNKTPTPNDTLSETPIIDGRRSAATRRAEAQSPRPRVPDQPVVPSHSAAAPETPSGAGPMAAMPQPGTHPIDSPPADRDSSARGPDALTDAWPELASPPWLARLRADLIARLRAAEPPAAEPVVHVSIGRVEVRAEKAPAAPAKQTRQQTSAVMSLDAYLQHNDLQQRGGRS